MIRNIKKENRVYEIFYKILHPVISLIFKIIPVGFCNMPSGAAVICGNHSDAWDPLAFLYCAGKKNNVRFMAKKEFERHPVIGPVLRKIGGIFVDRNATDINAIKETLFYLKSGEKVFIFPEGTRTGSDGSVDPKKGAIRIAAKIKCPIIPVHIPRKKKLFSSVRIHMGKPYYINAKTHEDFEAEANKLMSTIFSLAEEN